MDDALAVLERMGERLAQRGFVFGTHDDFGDRQLDGVLAKALEPWPWLGGKELPVDAKRAERLRRSPLREIGVEPFARDDERGEEHDALSAAGLEETGDDAVFALRRDCDVMIRAILRAQ